MDTIAYVLSYLDICEDEHLINELFSNEKERTIVRAYWLSQSTLEIIETENDIYYLTNSKYHRLDGPAIEYADGSKEYWVNDKQHRLDGPAIEYTNNYKAWYVNSKRHRIDGPAIEYANGSKEWWVNGIKQDTEEMVKSIEQKNSKV